MEAPCYQDVILCTFAVLLGFMVIVHTRSAVGQVNVTPSFFPQSLRSRGEGEGGGGGGVLVIICALCFSST